MALQRAHRCSRHEILRFAQDDRKSNNLVMLSEAKHLIAVEAGFRCRRHEILRFAQDDNVVRTMISIRNATIDEAASLSALCVRSKAHWGYDADFMRMSTPALAVSEADIAAGRVLVVCDGAGHAIGVASVVLEGGSADLDVMFVDPPAIGTGAGRMLFEAAAGLARRLGARRMTILADPNAASFYERMGARFLREAPSDAIPGRVLPLYEYDLTSRKAS